MAYTDDELQEALMELLTKSYSEGNSYEEILQRCLSSERLVNLDKRQGSVIYDTLAPLCMELAEAYIKMDIMADQSYLLTAIGSNLDRKVYDYGLVREQATYAERYGVFKGYLLDTDSNDYVYEYEDVGSGNGDYNQSATQYQYVGKGNGKYIYSTAVYTYEGSDQGSYDIVETHVGANKGDYLYNETDNIYLYVGEKKGNYTLVITNAGSNQGDYSLATDTYGLIDGGRGDYNEKYSFVGSGQGSYVRGEKVLVDIDIPIGSRFSVPNNSNLVFKFTEVRNLLNGKPAPYDAYEDYNILQCESAGTGGNGYYGTIIALTPTINLVEARMLEGTVTTARDDETDDDLRARAIEYLNNVAFGGNQSDYKKTLEAMEGVGAAKVFPAYIDENRAVMAFKASDGHTIPPEEVTNIGDVVKLHAQYKYVGSGEGSYSFEDNAYVEDEDGDYDLITSSYPITSANKLDFDGSVRISIVNDEFNPPTSLEIARIQDLVDPENVYVNVGPGNGDYEKTSGGTYVYVGDGNGDYKLTYGSGSGYGIAPIGHYVSIVSPTEDSVDVSIYVQFKSGIDEAAERTHIKNCIRNYVNSIRNDFAGEIPLQVIKSVIIAKVTNECPNVASIDTSLTTIESVKYGAQDVSIVYIDTANEQYIPVLRNVSVNGTPVIGD